MDDDRIDIERKAIAAYALQRVMAEIEACKRVHEQAGLPMPSLPVAMLRPEESPKVNERPALFTIPRPPAPDGTPLRGFTDKWIYLPLKDAQATSLVLAILNPAVATPLPELVTLVQEFKKNVNKGTIANIGTRLFRERLIQRTEKGWTLSHAKASSLVIDGDVIWGEPKDFQPEELAAFRRNMILHVMRSFSDGVQVAQLAKILNPKTHCPWFNPTIPVNKFLITADLKALAKENLVTMIPETKKWGLTQ